MEDVTEILSALKKLIMKPIYFNDLCVMLVDALPAKHRKNYRMKEHRHPWFEFNYVARGATYTTIEGVEFQIRKGQSYLIPPGASHSHRNAEEVSDEGFCLRWQFSLISDPERIDNRIGQFLIDTFQTPRQQALEPELVAPLMEIGANSGYISSQAALIQWFLHMFEHWQENHPHKLAIPDTPSCDKMDYIIQQAILYLEKYSATDFKVQDLANALHSSYRNLSRAFRRKTGLSIVEKLNDIRISRSKKLLMETDLTLREIAYETGFDNEFYLSKTFRRYARVTPTQFRKRRMENV